MCFSKLIIYPCLIYHWRNSLFWWSYCYLILYFYKWVFCNFSYFIFNFIYCVVLHLLNMAERVGFEPVRLKPLGHLSIIIHYHLFLMPQKKQSAEFRHYQIVSFFSFPFFVFPKVFSFYSHLHHKV